MIRESRIPCPRRVAAVALMLALVATACGGGSGSDSADDGNVVEGDTFRIELPDEINTVEEEPTEVPDASAGSESAAGETDTAASDEATADDAPADDEPAEVDAEPTVDPDAIPLEEEEAGVDDLFNAFDEFNACLSSNNYPMDLVPNGPNDTETFQKLTPDQIQVLQDCAASSRILQTLEDVQAANEDRTPEEIEIANQGVLLFVDCLRDNGWDAVDPTPDADGALGIAPDGFGAPTGEDVINSPVTRECAAEAQREAEAAAEAAG